MITDSQLQGGGDIVDTNGSLGSQSSQNGKLQTASERDPVSKAKIGVMEGAQHGLCHDMCVYTLANGIQTERESPDKFFLEAIDSRDIGSR